MTEIKNYAVRLHGGPKGFGDGTRAQIHLFDGNNKMVAMMDFVDPEVAIPADKLENGQIHMSFRISELTATVDILRNEEPIYVHWQEKAQNAYLSTTQEGVGEGE